MSSTIFAGNSRYASDFSTVIDRAVSLASLPKTQLQQGRAKLDSEASSLRKLSTLVSALQSAVTGLNGQLEFAAFQGYASDSTVLRPHLSDGVSEGTYTLEVLSLGSYTTAQTVPSSPQVANPDTQNITTATGEFTLTIDTDPDSGADTPIEVKFTPASGSLKSLVEAINREAGEHVQAAIVNIGTSNAPNYQLSLQSSKLGRTSIQINDGSQDLMQAPDLVTPGALGSMASYKVNGISVSADSRTVTVAPHLTVDLLKTAGRQTITVSSSTEPFTEALRSVISAYNNVTRELDKHHGNKDAVLSGQSILSTVSGIMRKIVTTPSGSGSLRSLADLGLHFDREGILSLDSTVHEKAMKSSMDDLRALVGNTDTGGVLKLANTMVNELTKSDTGLLAGSIKSTEEGLLRYDQRIAEEETRIERVTQDLQARMAAADAMIAALEQQVLYFTGMFESMRVASGSYN